MFLGLGGARLRRSRDFLAPGVAMTREIFSLLVENAQIHLIRRVEHNSSCGQVVVN
jgi:hypothetical protein